MSIFETLTSMNLPGDTVINLSLSEGVDVFVHNETDVDTAMNETTVINDFAELIATPGLKARDGYGNPILESLRGEGMLDDYTRGKFTFAEYLADKMTENFYDIDLIEYSTEKYDHKRGFTTLTAETSVTLENLLSTTPGLFGWDIAVKTANGTLTLDKD